METIGGVRWRKKALKPIETKRKAGDESEIAAEEEPLSPAARLFHEPSFNVHIIAIMGCKTRIYPQVVKDKLVHTLLKHPRFSSLQVVDEKNGGIMKWVQTEVNLDHHVIVPDLDPNMESPDKFVEDYISNLSKSTIDKSKPLWDLHLLNVKTSESEAVGIFRIHHSLGDGTSLMSLLLACTRKMSDPEALPTIPVKKNSGSDHSSGGLWHYLIGVWSVLGLVWNTLVDVVMFIATALFLKDSPTPLKGRPGLEFTPRRFVFRTISLDDMKLVKNAMNMTINDVALGITQAGLSKYLNRKYAELGKKDEGTTEKRNNLPKDIRLRSTLLINIRPSSGIQGLADMMEKDAEAKWGNWIGYVLLPFTVALRDDPLDYVRVAKATVDRKKRTLEAIYTFSIAEIVLNFFGIKAASALSHKVITHTTMCFSNLVGPLEEIGFYGHPMAYLAPSSYGQPHALMINFQSYGKKMTIVLSVDESTIPDPHQLCDDIVESLKLIKAAVLAKGLVKDDH
ncbi:wax ester synthase/diacylglycerol acyltransferase 11-like [Cornus florida]|uniref:wax ester synthase/diacylglycerol acyltransferase 11-like n=1 Tax=Cornus florida TaxID=4283 RepID=UPI002896764A|nr:wax ester synthase/diacylglycerol acyltransferase 11-like [Cornus florida]